MAQLIFGVRLGWFPVTALKGTTYELILPAFVLASLSLAYVARLMRTNLVENLRADYVRTAKAKGLTNTRTVGVHTLRNSLIPVITYIGIDIGTLMGGAVVTERIFNINGIGNFLYRSIRLKDGTTYVGSYPYKRMEWNFDQAVERLQECAPGVPGGQSQLDALVELMRTAENLPSTVRLLELTASK